MSEVRDEVLGGENVRICPKDPKKIQPKHTAAINTLLFVCFVLSGFRCHLL